MAPARAAAAPPVREASVSRSSYDPDPSQYGELYLPARAPLATVVVLHGGYWMDGFVAEAMRPLCRTLQADGFAVWNLEYRRIGAGGGWPTRCRRPRAATPRPAARAVSAPVSFHEVLGDHSSVVDPASPAWETIRAQLDLRAASPHMAKSRTRGNPAHGSSDRGPAARRGRPPARP